MFNAVNCALCESSLFLHLWKLILQMENAPTFEGLMDSYTLDMATFSIILRTEDTAHWFSGLTFSPYL